jgi:serine/threonine-protein kinase ULK/ATG1
MAPQVLSKNFYSYKCDVWSLGVIVYEFYFKKLPWRANNVTGLFFQIMDNPTPYLDQNAKLPTLLKCIFEYTLQPLEKERMTWE